MNVYYIFDIRWKFLVDTYRERERINEQCVTRARVYFYFLSSSADGRLLIKREKKTKNTHIQLTGNRTMGKIDLILIYSKRNKTITPTNQTRMKNRKQSTTEFETINCTVETQNHRLCAIDLSAHYLFLRGFRSNEIYN